MTPTIIADCIMFAFFMIGYAILAHWPKEPIAEPPLMTDREWREYVHQLVDREVEGRA